MIQYDEAAKKRIRWRTRRGLLELDLILQKFLAIVFDELSDADLTLYSQILDLPDPEFLRIINGKAEPEDSALLPLIDRIRAL